MPSEAAYLTGCPVPLVFANGDSFLASPLRDIDLAELDEWVQSRAIAVARQSLRLDMTAAERNETMEVAVRAAASMSWMTGAGCSLMSSNDGVSQMCHVMIRRHHPNMTAAELRARFFGDDDVNLTLNREALALTFRLSNGVEGDGGRASAGGSAPTKTDVYRALARFYKFTPSQIAEMTPKQQELLLSDDRTNGNEITFANMEEYQAWLATRNK